MDILNLKIGSSLKNGMYIIEKILLRSHYFFCYEGTSLDTHSKYFQKKVFIKEFSIEKNVLESQDTFLKHKNIFFENATKVHSFQAIPNVPYLIDTLQENGTVYIVSEFMEGTSLFEYVKQRIVLPQSNALKYYHKIKDTIDCLHTHDYFHNNITPENIFIDAKGELFITGFKLVPSLPPNITYDVTKLESMKHYIIYRNTYKKRDEYSLCAVLYYMVEGTAPPIITKQNNELLFHNNFISEETKHIIREGMLFDIHHSKNIIHTIKSIKKNDESVLNESVLYGVTDTNSNTSDAAELATQNNNTIFSQWIISFAIMVLSIVFLFLLGDIIKGYKKHSDRQTLVDLYDSLNGDTWINNTKWKSENPLEEWYGVTTGVYGKVVRLELSGNNMSGTISPSIQYLKHIKVINFSENKIKGTIPDAMALLNNIQKIDISWNFFTGNIPDSLFTIPSLEFLDVSHNLLNKTEYPFIWNNKEMIENSFHERIRKKKENKF